MVPDRDTCLALNLTWQNSVVTFDHVGHAYLALFEVAIFKGWITVMYDATDSRQVRGTWIQPRADNEIFTIFENGS